MIILIMMMMTMIIIIIINNNNQVDSGGGESFMRKVRYTPLTGERAVSYIFLNKAQQKT